MFIADGKLAICTGCEVKVEVENNVFANSLLGATTQDGGTRERSNKLDNFSGYIQQLFIFFLE